MPVIVLAAGEGVRLRPLTKYRPKPMLPAGTSPILEHVLDGLLESGLTNVHLVVGHRRSRIQSHFGSTYRGIELTYHTQEKQLGTGHALLAANPPVDRPFMVVYGDQIVDHTLVTDVLRTHQDAAGVATLGVLPGKDVAPYGGAIVQDGEVIDLVDRPEEAGDYVLNAGVYVFEGEVIEAVASTEPRDGEQSMIDGLTALVNGDETVAAAVSDGFWVDATFPWDLLAITERVLGREDGGRAAERHSVNSIHESAVIREPVAIAPDCEIGPGAVVGPDTALGENVTIGANAVVSHSLLDSDTRVGPNATLVDVVSGVGAHVGAGSSAPGGPGDVRVDDRVFENQRLGALLADRVVDRGGVTYLPGTVVGADSDLGTGGIVRGSLPEGTTLRS